MDQKSTSGLYDEFKMKELSILMTDLRAGCKKVVEVSLHWVRSNLLILLLLLTGTALYNFFQFKNQPVFYTSKSSFIYTDLHKKVYGEMIDKIDELLQTHSYKTIAGLLQVDEQLIYPLIGVKAINLYGSKLSEDITTEKSPFYIVVTAGEKQVFDSLHIILEQYLNNNVYAAAQRERKNNIIRKEVIHNQKELAMLDSLKRQLPVLLHSGDHKEPLTLDIAGLYDRSISLYKDILEKEDIANHQKSVEVLTAFVVHEYPERKTITYYILRTVISFFIMAVAVIFLRFLFKK